MSRIEKQEIINGSIELYKQYIENLKQNNYDELAETLKEGELLINEKYASVNVNGSVHTILGKVEEKNLIKILRNKLNLGD